MVVSIAWAEVEDGDDVEGQLDDVLASASSQPGLDIARGDLSADEVNGHEALAQGLMITEGGERLAGRAIAWHCPETGRAFVFIYATQEDASGELAAGLEALLEGLRCHD